MNLINGTLTVTVALSFSGPFNLGLATSMPDAQVQARLEQVELLAQATSAPDVDQWIDPEITGLEQATVREVVAALPNTDVYRENVVIVLRDGVFVNRVELRDIYSVQPGASEARAAKAAQDRVDPTTQELREALPSKYVENLVVPGYWTHPLNDRTGLRLEVWSKKPSDPAWSGWSRSSIGSASMEVALPEEKDLRVYSLGTDRWGNTVFLDQPYIFFALQGNNINKKGYEVDDGNLPSYDQTTADMGLVYRERERGTLKFWSAFVNGPVNGEAHWDNPGEAAPNTPGNYSLGSRVTIEMFVLGSPFPSVTTTNGGRPVNPADADAPGDAAPWAWTCLHTRLRDNGANPITICHPLPDVDPTGAHNYIELEAGLAQDGGTGAGEWGYTTPYQKVVNPRAIVLGTGSYMVNMNAADVRLGATIKGKVLPNESGNENSLEIADGAYINDIITTWSRDDIYGSGHYPDYEDTSFVQLHENITKLRVDFCNSGWNADAGEKFSDKCLFNEDNLRIWRTFMDSWVEAFKAVNASGNVEGFGLSNDEVQRYYEACEFSKISAAVTVRSDTSPAFRFGGVMAGAQKIEDDPRYSFCALNGGR